MEKITISLIGISPLLMHSNKCANPISKEAKVMKEHTSKRSKTDKDFELIARLEWEAGLYLFDGIVGMPSANIEKCFLLGARKAKMGKQFEAGCFADQHYAPLNYAGTKIKAKDGIFPNSKLDKYYKEHSHQAMVRVQSSQILRTRPIFYDWSCEISFLYSPEIINRKAILNAAQSAGEVIGLCEMRPRMGRFDVKQV